MTWDIQHIFVLAIILLACYGAIDLAFKTGSALYKIEQAIEELYKRRQERKRQP